MPTGKVKFFSPEKGFGFISYDDGDDVFVHSDALPEGVTELKKGQRVEFGVVSGRKGNQAMQVRLLDPVPSVATRTARTAPRTERKPAEDLAPLVEDLIKVLDEVGESLRRGRYPERAEARQIAGLLRGFAGELDA